MHASALDRKPSGVHLRRAAWIPGLIAVLASLALGVVSSEPSELAARCDETTDSDGDGLVDCQEEVLRTDPDDADTDADGYGDLEEIARGSDPLDDAVIPNPNRTMTVGVTGRAVSGIITTVSAVYVRASSAQALEFNLGFVFGGGMRVEVSPAVYQPLTRARLVRGNRPKDLLAVVEIPIPESLVRSLGSLSIYSTVTDPLGAPGNGSASVIDLVDFAGVTMLASAAPPEVQGGIGVIYRPLAPDEEIPASWTAGEICWQQTRPVGVAGSSIVHEVSGSACAASDTYCSGTDCAAAVGSGLELVDPASLLGG